MALQECDRSAGRPRETDAQESELTSPSPCRRRRRCRRRNHMCRSQQWSIWSRAQDHEHQEGRQKPSQWARKMASMGWDEQSIRLAHMMRTYMLLREVQLVFPQEDGQLVEHPSGRTIALFSLLGLCGWKTHLSKEASTYRAGLFLIAGFHILVEMTHSARSLHFWSDYLVSGNNAEWQWGKQEVQALRRVKSC